MSFAIISIHYPTALLISVAGCVGCTVTTTITTANTDRLRPSSVLTGSVITASTAVAGTVVSADCGSVTHDVSEVTINLSDRAVSSPMWSSELSACTSLSVVDRREEFVDLVHLLYDQ